MSVPSNRVRYHGSTPPRKQCTPGASWGSGGYVRPQGSARGGFSEQLNRAEPSATAAVLNERRHSPLDLRDRILLAAQGVDFLCREERGQLGPRVLAPELTA